ncbi:MAG: amidophosphoribosyltransferase [Eggerthellaceae bacterium]|nr:amidophosphoribosyltransferase [Eggerthellaceae bacterium]
MGGFFGAVDSAQVINEIFFGTDYHSHLGTKSGGIVVWDKDRGYTREIHSIESVPFRSRFEHELGDFIGTSGIGCISDSDPQPLMVRSKLGLFALSTLGVINNPDELTQKVIDHGFGQFMAMSSGKINDTELVASLINTKDSLVDGIRFAQSVIDGSMTITALLDDGSLIAARDGKGRLPVLIGKRDTGYCMAFESFSYMKLGYESCYELGPGEIVKITADGIEVLSPAGKDMKICAFLWTYYGYPNSDYEGKNVETMRYKNGALMARKEIEQGALPDVDYVAGMPDSGIPHAIGYANESHLAFARPFIKYTPSWLRSFTPSQQSIRNQIAAMKQIPIPELIDGKKALLVDDSIVRGTQLRETVDFLYSFGAKEVHMRSACPPIMYSCKYLNFSVSASDMDLLARRTIQELEGDEGQKHLEEYADGTTERGKCMLKNICEKMGFDSLGYQSLDGMLEAIGIDKDKICTYCWTGKE